MTNLVFVVADEFRQQSLGFMNEDRVITKNLDRFANESTVINNAYSNFPVCSPYRAMLFTGRYPYKNGVIGNCNSKGNPYGVYLRDRDVCISDCLALAGYETGYIGKWHLDSPEPSEVDYLEGYRQEDGILWDAYTPPGPKRHGFKFWHSYGCCDRHLEPHYWHNDAKVDERICPKEWSVKHETDVAVSYILNEDGKQRDPNKPFALFVSYNPPHMPFEQVPEEYVRMYDGVDNEDLLDRANVSRLQDKNLFDRRDGEEFYNTALSHVKNYFAAVTGVDDNFGRILDAIDRTCKDDTIVIFTSDHGEMMGSHGLMYKTLWYDESFKVPFLIRFPNKIPVKRSNLFLNVPDLMPTILSLMNQKAPENIDGFDKSDHILKGFEVYEDELMNEVFYLNPMANLRGLRNSEYMFVVKRNYHNDESYRLFKVSDKYQLNDVAPENPNVVKELRARLDVWLQKSGDIWL